MNETDDLAARVAEFLDDPNIPTEIRALVKARLCPEPQWTPEVEEAAPAEGNP